MRRVHLRARFALAALAIGLTSCGGRPARTVAPARALAIQYGVEAERPPESFEFTLGDKGLARLVLRRARRNEPYAPVGFFAVRPKPRDQGQIENVIRDFALLDRSDEPGFTAGGSGHLRLAHGTRRAEVSLLAKDEGANSLRLLLDGLVEAARQRPVAALKVVSSAQVDGPNVAVDLTLSHRGVEPLELSIFEPKAPKGTLTVRVVFERGGRLADERFLSPDDVARLIARKKLPSGRHALQPGERLVVPLPLVALPPRPSELALRVEVGVTGRLRGQEAQLLASSPLSPIEPEAPPED